MRDLSSPEFAWAVGVFEGEGYIAPVGPTKQWRMGIEMTDLDILERVHSAFGVGHMVRPRQRHAHWKVCYGWHCGEGVDVRPLLIDMLPLLGDRRSVKASQAVEDLVGFKRIAKEAPHGTVGRYTSRKWKCRCADCTQAMKDYQLNYRKKITT